VAHKAGMACCQSTSEGHTQSLAIQSLRELPILPGFYTSTHLANHWNNITKMAMFNAGFMLLTASHHTNHFPKNCGTLVVIENYNDMNKADTKCF